MGIFRALFGGKTTEEESEKPACLESVESQDGKLAKNFHKRASQIRWGWTQPDARALVHEVLNHAATHFEKAVVKEVPDSEHIDLRARFDGAPVRFAVWMTFGSFWAVEMLCENRNHGFTIERDHEKIPSVQDADDPFAKNETRRIFVAKGIFFEDKFGDVGKSLAIWEGMPDEVQNRILGDMERLEISSVSIHSDSIKLHQNPGIRDLPDGVAYMVACAELMAFLKNLSPSSRAESSKPTGVRTESSKPTGVRTSSSNRQDHRSRELSCQYCHSLYWMTATRTHCPNCGAPPAA